MQKPIKFITSRLSENSVQCKTIGVHSISSWCTWCSVSVCCEAEENPLEFITSSGLHYRFLVYPQLSAHVITPVIDFSQIECHLSLACKVTRTKKSNLKDRQTVHSGSLDLIWLLKNIKFSILHNSFHGPLPSRHVRSYTKWVEPISRGVTL